MDFDGENQDTICYGENMNFFVISLADGVSDCSESKCGAEIASKSIANLLLKKGDHFWQFEEEKIAELVLSHILYELNERAMKDSKDINEYSSTIACVLVDKNKDKMLSYSIGDSIILAIGNGRSRVLAMPSDSLSGCCVTTTRNVGMMTSIKILDTVSIESIVICSDGAWQQMYTKNSLKVEVAAMLANNEYDELKNILLCRIVTMTSVLFP